jgi:ubiquinone/menaquinone biosynthesis C-methylase UbiE
MIYSFKYKLRVIILLRMDKDNLQFNFAASQPKLYDIQNRVQKANKTISVIQDYFTNNTSKSLANLVLLDIGSSTGIMSNEYSKHFKKVFAIDIDSDAIKFAEENFSSNKLEFVESSVEDLKYKNEKFDVITCSHIYEHVPDANKLIEKIYDLLKPGGVCYFAAGNRYKVIEGHYKLPFLSFFPKPISNIYLKLTGKGSVYYENHLSLPKLQNLVSEFETIDYTQKIINYPSRFSANELIHDSSFRHKIIKFLSKYFYFFIPTYIWILLKKTS